MSPSHSKSADRPRARASVAGVAMLAALGSLFVVRDVQAQACCAGSSIFAPARLALDEDYLVALGLRGAYGVGSFTPEGTFVGAPSGTTELALGQDVLGALRLSRSVQLALTVPFLETYRRTRSSSELGGGVGDVQLAARWDVFSALRTPSHLGLAVLGAVSAPTGTAPEDARTPLATGATGVGAFQGHVGVAGEAIRGSWLFNVAAFVAARTPRHVSGLTSVLGPRASFLLGAAYVAESGLSTGVSLSYDVEAPAWIDGQTVAGSGRRLLSAALSAAWPFAEGFRLQGNVAVTPPLPAVSANEPASVSATVLLAHTGLFPASP